jgi:hypothetical protein
MSVSTQPHMRMEGETPVPCGCSLGYHHTPDGEPLTEVDDVTGQVILAKGRHPYCVGACKVWGTPTEEFDFRLTTGSRVSQHRISTGVKITDRTMRRHHGVIVSWDNDPIAGCAMLGVLRLAARKNTPPAPEEST